MDCSLQHAVEVELWHCGWERTRSRSFGSAIESSPSQQRKKTALLPYSKRVLVPSQPHRRCSPYQCIHVAIFAALRVLQKQALQLLQKMMWFRGVLRLRSTMLRDSGVCTNIWVGSVAVRLCPSEEALQASPLEVGWECCLREHCPCATRQ